MNTMLICKCCSQIFELCHAFKGHIPYLYALPSTSSRNYSKTLYTRDNIKYVGPQVGSWSNQDVALVLYTAQ
jgi:hypothetical protein